MSTDKKNAQWISTVHLCVFVITLQREQESKAQRNLGKFQSLILASSSVSILRQSFRGQPAFRSISICAPGNPRRVVQEHSQQTEKQNNLEIQRHIKVSNTKYFQNVHVPVESHTDKVRKWLMMVLVRLLKERKEKSVHL